MVEIIFWLAVGLIAYAQIGYPLLIRVLAHVRGPRAGFPGVGYEPTVSLIVACHNEERVIEAKLDNALGLEYPEDKLEVVVVSDGSSDRTVELARRIAVRDARVKVLGLPRMGKVAAQNEAVAASRGEILAFSDANASWSSDALRLLMGAFAEDDVGYVCGEVSFLDAAGTNQEGAYWRYELALRRAESRLRSITAGNGAIYATRRRSYIEVDPRMGHDLSLPFNMVKRGWRALVVPEARATEKMIPDVEGEFRRKRRMMSHTWLILLRGGMLNPRGYGFIYGVEILSHRLVRYTSPFLHLVALGTNVALVGEAPVYAVMLAVQVAVLLLAGAGAFTRARTRFLAAPYYYVALMAALAAGLWDLLRYGVPATWTPVEEVR